MELALWCDMRVMAESAQELARLPQICLRADRRSVGLHEGKCEREGLRLESGVVALEGAAGAARFAAGAGRHGAKAE